METYLRHQSTPNHVNMSYNFKKPAFVILASALALNSFSQIDKPRQVAVPGRMSKDTIPVRALPNKVIVAQPAQPVQTVQPVKTLSPAAVSKVALHTQVVRNVKGTVTLKPVQNAIYGDDGNFKSLRMQQFNHLSTEPSFTKTLNGINIRYQLRKNPNYDAPPTANQQGGGTASVENGMNCTTTRESVTARSASFLSVSADGAGIYPGAIYNYADFYGGSTLKTVGDGQRNPIVIYTSNIANSTGDVAVTVTNPSASSITQATAPITRNFSTTVTSATSIGQYTYSNNSAAMALNISAGGAYSGFSASAGFQINKQDNHVYITCDYKIPLYTLSTEIPRGGFFTDPSIEQTPNLLLVSSVMYGTRILANIDIDETGLSDSAFATFQYGDPSKAGAKAAFDYLQKTKSKKITINTYTVGTAAGLSLHPVDVDQLLSQIDAVIRNTTYQTAKPISYTLADMAGNLIGVESATDVYTVKNCVPQGAQYKLTSAQVEIQCGPDGKDNGSPVNVTLSTRGNSNGSNFTLAAEQTGNTEFTANSRVAMVMNVRQDGAIKLDDFKAGINRLDIFLEPKQVFLGWDAWDIKSVTLVLKFNDQNGTPLPEPLRIEMNNANVRLEKNRQRVICYFNGQFQATTTMQPQ
jgi:hypothetical protein